MALFSTLSVAVLLPQLTVLILTLSPTTNCLSLDDRSQLTQLAEDFVRITNTDCYDYNNYFVNYVKDM